MNLDKEIERVVQTCKTVLKVKQELAPTLIYYEDTGGTIKLHAADLSQIEAMSAKVGHKISGFDRAKVIGGFGGFLAAQGRKIIATILIAEAWSAEMKKEDIENIDKLPSPSTQPNRKETLIVNARDTSGNEASFVYEILRSLNFASYQTEKIVKDQPYIELRSKAGQIFLNKKDGKDIPVDSDTSLKNAIMDSFWNEFNLKLLRNNQ